MDEGYFSLLDSGEKAYWLGFLYADGYQNGQEMIVNLAPKDLEHLLKLQQALQSERPIAIERRVSLRVSSRRLCQDLANLGCVRAKTFTLVDPPPSVDPIYYPHLVRGYFDGDGWVSGNPHRGQLSMHCAAPVFRSWLLTTLRQAGIDAHNTATQLSRNITVTNRENAVRFFRYIYDGDTVSLARKKKRAESILACIKESL